MSLESRPIGELLRHRASFDPAYAYCLFEGERVTIGALHDSVERLARGLYAKGYRKGDRIALMLANHPDHIRTIFACARLGLVWIPVNIHLKGAALEFLFTQADPRGVVGEADYRGYFADLLRPDHLQTWRDGDGFAGLLGTAVGAEILEAPGIDDLFCISFTSGTTGVPKAAMLSHRSFLWSVEGGMLLADIVHGDVLFHWEPLYHIAGAQMMVAALVKPLTLGMVPRFSASRFWAKVREFGATHIHYIGGVLQILLKQPPDPADSQHKVRIAFGGGCPKEIWRTFEERFSVRIREAYGISEVSSFVTINTAEKLGSIGMAVPFLEVVLEDEAGNVPPVGEVGEIVTRERQPGVMFSGYFRNEEATRAAFKDGWFHTGDLARADEEGFLYFQGRKKDMIRRRGENISAWEVERVLNQHPAVEESAVIGVPDGIGDEDLKAFIRVAVGHELDIGELMQWSVSRLPYFQIPRFVAMVTDFPRTPSQRIKKQDLPRSTGECWDAERPGSANRG